MTDVVSIVGATCAVLGAILSICYPLVKYGKLEATVENLKHELNQMQLGWQRDLRRLETGIETLQLDLKQLTWALLKSGEKENGN